MNACREHARFGDDRGRGRQPPGPRVGIVTARATPGSTDAAPARSLAGLGPVGNVGERRVVVRAGERTITGRLSVFDPELHTITIREDLDRAAGVVRTLPLSAVDMVSFAESSWMSAPTVPGLGAPSARIAALLLRNLEVAVGVATPSGVTSAGLFITPLDAAWLDRVFVTWRSVEAVPEVHLPDESGGVVPRTSVAELRRRVGERSPWIRSAPWQTAIAAAMSRAKAGRPVVADRDVDSAVWSPARIEDPRGRAIVGALDHGVPFVSRGLGPWSRPSSPVIVGPDPDGPLAVVVAMAAGGVVVAVEDPGASGLRAALDATMPDGWALVVAERSDLERWRSDCADVAIEMERCHAS